MKVVFRTNLDEAKRDVWDLNDVETSMIPRKGERIKVPFHKGVSYDRYAYLLEVVDVTYDFAESAVEIELHIPSFQRSMSVREWTEWFRNHRYGTPVPQTSKENGQ